MAGEYIKEPIANFMNAIKLELSNYLEMYKEKKADRQEIEELVGKLHSTFEGRNHPFETKNIIGTLKYYGVELKDAFNIAIESGNIEEESNVRDLIARAESNYRYFNEECLNPRKTISRICPDAYLKPLEENMEDINNLRKKCDLSNILMEEN